MLHWEHSLHARQGQGGHTATPHRGLDALLHPFGVEPQRELSNREPLLTYNLLTGTLPGLPLAAYLLTGSLTPAAHSSLESRPTHSLVHSLTHAFAHVLTHSLTQCNALTHSLTHSLTHPLTCSLTHSLAHTARSSLEFRSPTTTPLDKELAAELAKISGIDMQ